MTKPVTWDQLIEAAQDQDKLHRRPGQPGRGADGVDQRPDRVGRRARSSTEPGRRARRTSSWASTAEPAERGRRGHARASPTRASAARRCRPPARTPTPPRSRAATPASWSTGRSSGPGRWRRSRAGTLDQSVPDDYGWALYPQVVEGEDERAAATAGINLGVGAFSEHPDLAYEAAECITSDGEPGLLLRHQRQPGRRRRRSTTTRRCIEAFPMAPVIRESLEQAAPRPQTPYYSEVSSSLQRDLPPAGVGRPGDAPAGGRPT